MLNAYELSEKKNKIICTINYLERERNYNNTETVLLTNEEVEEIIESMNECVGFINEKLKSVLVP